MIMCSNKTYFIFFKNSIGFVRLAMLMPVNLHSYAVCCPSFSSKLAMSIHIVKKETSMRRK